MRKFLASIIESIHVAPGRIVTPVFRVSMDAGPDKGRQPRGGPVKGRGPRARSGPHTARIGAAENDLLHAEHEASVARIRDRLDRLSLEPPSRTIERGVGIEPPGL